MKKQKTVLSIMATVLILTVAISVASPLAEAHTPAWTIPTWCYISASSNPIGVNQQVLIVFWVNAPPPGSAGQFGDRYTFYVDVTKPDGAKETLGPIKSDPVGGGYAAYIPTQVGNYTFVARYPGQTLTGLPTLTGVPGIEKGDIMLESTSDQFKLTVQSQQMPIRTETPLPTEYWKRPINSMNRNWYVLAGSWLGGAAQIVDATTSFAFGKGPESAHVMWTKPYFAGGIMDERFGNTGFQTYHYGGLIFDDSIIIDGKLYYQYRANAQETEGWICADLYTGETIYYSNTTMPSFGQVYNYKSPNQYGGFPYLWVTSGVTLPPNTTSTTTWELIDGFNGNGHSITKIANVSSSGTAVYGKDGSILRYSISGTSTNQRLLVWNSSAIPTLLLSETTGTGLWQWQPQRLPVHDGRRGFSLNVSITSPVSSATIRAVREDEFIIGGSTGSNNENGLTKGVMWCISLKKGEEGKMLWTREFTPPSSAGNKTINMRQIAIEDGVFLFSCTQTRQYWGYSLETGELLWGPTASEPSFNYYYWVDAAHSNIYQGKLITAGYSGELTAYNITTGKIIWKYSTPMIDTDVPYGAYPIGISNIADGKIYCGTSEHSPTQPMWRAPGLRCVDANTGKEIWRFSVFGVRGMSGTAAGGGNFIMSDGLLLALNAYDNQIYCFGKGPSATTVTAVPEVATARSSMLIKGTITDQTPSSKGTPAISDESMTAWMEYLYMQQPKPTNATGVKVHLTALDPNGNYQDIGTSTSDAFGNYAISWKPPVPGIYNLKATFEGTNSYYRSEAGTTFLVSEATSTAPLVNQTPQPSATQPPAPTQTAPQQTATPATSIAPPPTAAEPTTTYIAIGAVVIIVVIVAAALVLRKRK